MVFELFRSRRSISTHTPLARRDLRFTDLITPTPISTHTPLARRDFDVIYKISLLQDFYSHASREA